MQDHKREFSRVTLNLKIRLLFEDGSELAATVTNLGLNGALCTTVAHVPYDTSCDVILVFDSTGGALTIKATGRIARVPENFLAVEFTRLEIEDYHHLCNLIRGNAPDPDIVNQEFSSHHGLKPRGVESALSEDKDR